MKELIFSTIPMIGTFNLLQKFISFLTSKTATSCGVVITTAPVTPASFKYDTTDKCSSLVPGGVSISK